MVFLTVAAVTVVRTAANEGSSSRGRAADAGHSRRSQPKQAGEKGLRRLREGTIVSDQSGYFREDGDGATFIADAGIEFGALPNLNLERVVRLLKSSDEPNSIRWSVNGEVTEFTGRNFLLISRAAYKPATPPPVPDRIVQ